MRQILHLETLPKAERQEIVDFYEFLKSRSANRRRTIRPSVNSKSLFFHRVEEHSFQLPDTYSFDREEANAR